MAAMKNTLTLAVSTAAVVIALVLGFVVPALHASAAHAATTHGFSSGGKQITVSIACNASGTYVNKVSGSSGVSYAAESYGGRPGHWVKGNTVTGGQSVALVAQRTNSGVYVFGALHVTGC
jgi:hypothetical protein